MKYLYRLAHLSLLLFCLGLIGVSAQTSGNAPQKIRVGLAAVKVTSVSEGVDPQQFGAGVQNTLTEYLKGTNVELVAIEAKLPSAIENEIKEKSLDYVVYVSAAHKKGGGGFGKMFSTVAPVLGQVAPMAGMGGNVAGAIAGSVATTAIMTASSMSSSVKAKDTLQFDLTIQKNEPKTNVVAKSFKGKAKSDGEDIFTPLIEQMAQSVIDAANIKTETPAADNK